MISILGFLLLVFNIYVGLVILVLIVDYDTDGKYDLPVELIEWEDWGKKKKGEDEK